MSTLDEMLARQADLHSRYARLRVAKFAGPKESRRKMSMLRVEAELSEIRDTLAVLEARARAEARKPPPPSTPDAVRVWIEGTTRPFAIAEVVKDTGATDLAVRRVLLKLVMVGRLRKAPKDMWRLAC